MQYFVMGATSRMLKLSVNAALKQCYAGKVSTTEDFQQETKRQEASWLFIMT
jgi:hypothetical protein